MNKLFAAILLVLVSLATLSAANDESIESLKARAAAASGSKQVELFTEIAEHQLGAVAKAYDEGQTKQAEVALHDVQEYGLKAAQTSQETGKRMKNTEIAIRKISDKLEDLSRSIDTDERPPVTKALKQLEAARSELLRYMFRKR